MANKQAWKKLNSEAALLLELPATHWSEIDNWALRLLPLIRQQFSEYEKEFREYSTAPEILFISAGMEDAEFNVRYNQRCEDQKDRLINLLQGILHAHEHDTPNDAVEDKLKEFRRRFGNAKAFPWDDIEVIAEEARPFIQRHLPDEIERFDNSTKGPSFTYRIHPKGFQNPEDPDAVVVRSRQEVEHGKMCQRQRRLLVAYLDGLISAGAHKAQAHAKAATMQTESGDPRKVFVVYGRNEHIRLAMFSFLRSIDLHPMEWSQLVALTGKSSPYIGEVLNVGFREARAAVVIMTPDDEARLIPGFWKDDDPNDERDFTRQPRQNVLLEAGMALGISEERTVIVTFGKLRQISDILGRHVVRMTGASFQSRKELAQRLQTAGCAVNTTGNDWVHAGDFALNVFPEK
jgi:predicted nucleotide-binding protein